MDMDISMDIHAKSVDMDGKFHFHGNPEERTDMSKFKVLNNSTDERELNLLKLVYF